MPELERRADVLRQSQQELAQERHVGFEIRRQLVEHRCELRPERPRDFGKRVDELFAVAQPLLVRDPLPRFERETEARWNLRGPALQDLRRRLPVERIVDLDGGKALGVVPEHLLRRQILGIEAAPPGFVVVTAGADVDHACTSLRYVRR